MLETDNQCLTRFCNVKSEEMTIIVCCSLCFISDSLKLLKEIIYVYVSHYCHMPRHEGHKHKVQFGKVQFHFLATTTSFIYA